MLILPILAQAQTYCVRQGATGNGSGSDWANAFPTLPASLQRGATYYIADGSYSAYTFDDAVSGSTFITIKKATEATHGPAGGWDPSYGDGQAVFSATIRFLTSNWIFDGSKRNENDWFDGAAYGFRIAHNNQDKQISIENTDVDNIKISYTHLLAIQGNLPSTTIGRYGFNLYDPTAWGGYAHAGGKFEGYVVARCFFQYGNVPFFVRAGEGLIWEYCAVQDSISNSANHGEAMSAYENNNNFIIRYNKFLRVAGTAIIALTGGGGFHFYGNTVKDCNTSDGVIGFAGRSSSNNKVHNNTIVGGTGYNAGTAWGSGTGNETYNNIFVNNASLSIGGTHNYNVFHDGNARGEANAQLNFSTANFNDYAAGDFRLKNATTAGTTLGAPFNTDLTGAPRGSDGTFDRGAYEFGPNTGGNLTANAGNDQSITLPATVSLTGTYVNLLGGLVTVGWSKVSGPGTVNFSTPSAANTTASFSSAGTYVLRLTVSVLTISITDDVTITVANAPDSTAPTIALTAPSGGVSGSLSMSATASDNIGVAGVKFYVGNNLVVDDTTSPYSATWDSSWAANGSYGVYAQARDAQGNIKWSATNSITINNAANTLPTPAAYWAFNETSGTTAADSAGNSLTLRNGANWTTGRFGNGMSLDGIDDRADVSNRPAFDYDGDQMTVAAWVKLENNNDWQQIAVKVKEVGAFNAPYFSWHLFGGTDTATTWRPQFQVVNTSENSVNVSSTVTVNYGQWVHVVGVYDGAAVRLYINGQPQGSAAQSGNIIRHNAPLYIGAHGQPAEHGKGVIDEVRIYSRAMTPAQIQALYNLNPGGSSGQLAPPTGLRLSGL